MKHYRLGIIIFQRLVLLEFIFWALLSRTPATIVRQDRLVVREGSMIL